MFAKSIFSNNQIKNLIREIILNDWFTFKMRIYKLSAEPNAKLNCFTQNKKLKKKSWNKMWFQKINVINGHDINVLDD